MLYIVQKSFILYRIYDIMSIFQLIFYSGQMLLRCQLKWQHEYEMCVYTYEYNLETRPNSAPSLNRIRPQDVQLTHAVKLHNPSASVTYQWYVSLILCWYLADWFQVDSFQDLTGLLLDVTRVLVKLFKFVLKKKIIGFLQKCIHTFNMTYLQRNGVFRFIRAEILNRISW